MKNSLLRSVAPSILGLFLVSTLTAQTGSGSGRQLVVKVGDEFEYEGVLTKEYRMVGPDGSSSPVSAQEIGMMDLFRVDSITTDRIFWTSQMLAVVNGDRKSTLPMTVRMVTDLEGRIQQIGGASEHVANGEELFSFSTGNSEQKQQGPGWFMPVELADRENGESWTVESLDTVTVTVAAGIEMEMETDSRMVFTSGGLVDTLGSEMIRVDWKTEHMSFGGEFAAPNGKMTFPMEGEGEMKGTSYYKLADRMLYCQEMETTITMRIVAGEIDQTVMTIQRTTQTRQD